MQAGNGLFQRGAHREAAREYSAALDLAVQLQQPDQAPLRAILHSNRRVCYPVILELHPSCLGP